MGQLDPLSLLPQTEAELAQRLVLVYTGQQRLANKNAWIIWALLNRNEEFRAPI